MSTIRQEIEKDYDRIFVSARKLSCRILTGWGYSPEDLISNAYITFFESGWEYNFDSFFKVLRIEAFKLKATQNTAPILSQEKYRGRLIKDTEKYCNGCKEVLPMGFFRPVVCNGYHFYSAYCISCQKISYRKYYLLNKKKINAKCKKYYHTRTKVSEKHIINKKEYCREWYIDHKALVVARSMKRRKLYIETLADSYIREVLKQQGVKDPTKEQVIAKRKYLITERERRLKKEQTPREINLNKAIWKTKTW